GGFGQAVAAPQPLPDRSADRSVVIRTSPRQALLYRLSGDYNPLHADPEVARRAGFDRPILHGLCTMGIACRALLAAYCGNEPSRLGAISNRFTSPVLPGETLRIDFFEEGPDLRFRGTALERNEV